MRPSSRSIPPDDFLGVLSVASTGALALVGFIGLGTIAWGAALIFASTAAYALVSWIRIRPDHANRWDAWLLAGGAALGVLATSVPATIGPLLSVAGAVPLAVATRRLLQTPSRGLVLASAGPILVALAIAAALDLSKATTLPWFVGIAAAVIWPASVMIAGARARSAAGALRRELLEADRHIQREDYARSLQDYDRAIRLGAKGIPGEDLPWYGKGATLILLGRYEEALRAIDTALDINPRNEVAWVNKGNALTRMGRLMDALRCFNAALKVNPGYEVAWNNRGNTLARLGKNEEALRCYDKALGIDASYRGAWVNKGYVLTKLGRYEEASACADRALRVSRSQRSGTA